MGLATGYLEGNGRTSSAQSAQIRLLMRTGIRREDTRHLAAACRFSLNFLTLRICWVGNGRPSPNFCRSRAIYTGQEGGAARRRATATTKTRPQRRGLWITRSNAQSYPHFHQPGCMIGVPLTCKPQNGRGKWHCQRQATARDLEDPPAAGATFLLVIDEHLNIASRDREHIDNERTNKGDHNS